MLASPPGGRGARDHRDPRAFGADADRVDITRDARAHMAFGLLRHLSAPGAELARVELRIALPRLFARLPGLRLAVPAEELEFKQHSIAYGLKALPVTW